MLACLQCPSAHWVIPLTGMSKSLGAVEMRIPADMDMP